jgi:hypothetical protein
MSTNHLAYCTKLPTHVVTYTDRRPDRATFSTRQHMMCACRADVLKADDGVDVVSVVVIDATQTT